MAVHEKTPDDLAYTLTKTMLEKVDDLTKVHKEAANIKPAAAEVRQRRHSLAPRRAEVLQGKGHRHRVIGDQLTTERPA